jgi:predicted PurR-regulated permease PerM
MTADDLDADAQAVATGVTRTVEAIARSDASAHEAADKAGVAERELPAPVTKAASEAAQTAEVDADVALELAREAEQQALAVAEEADELLLDKEARELAAQVSEQQPYGLPGRRGDRSSPFRWGFTVTAGALLALVLGQAIATVEHELLLILIAAFVAIGLDPAVRFLVRRGMRRSFAVAVIVFAFLGAVAAFVAAAVPPLVEQATQLSDKGPGYLKQLNDKHTLLGRLNLEYHVSDNLQRKVSGSGISAGGVLHAGTVVLSATFETIIVLALVIYFLADLSKIKNAVYRLVPKHRRPRVGLLGDEILARVGGYVLGNVLTSVVATVGSYVVLLILGVPYALVLSILVGILDLIPLVGSTIGGAIVALVALATVSGTAALITVIYHVFYRLFADYVLNPRVLRRTVDVSPVVTVIAVLIGGALLGVTGALIAVPAAAAIQLVLVEVVYPQRDSEDAPA